MSLRAAVGRFGAGFGLAAALTAGGVSHARCEKDVRGPSFDPEALERGAKALREINASPYAKKVPPCLLAMFAQVSLLTIGLLLDCLT